MQGGASSRRDAAGMWTNTHGVTCDECKADLHLFAVAAAAQPGRAVCPQHADALGVPAEQCTLLYR